MQGMHISGSESASVSPSKSRAQKKSWYADVLVWLGGFLLLTLSVICITFLLTPDRSIGDLPQGAAASRHTSASGVSGGKSLGTDVIEVVEMHQDTIKEGISDGSGIITHSSDKGSREKWEHGTIEYPPTLHFPPSVADVPEELPEGIAYPQYRPLLDILADWNPDIADPPSHFTETIQHFDFSNATERAMAATFRNAELPFKVYNVPEFEEVRQKWTDGYLIRQMGTNSKVHVEKSDTNHFMYWTGRNLRTRTKKTSRDTRQPGTSNSVESWEAPTDILRDGEMMFPEWLKIAKNADKLKPPSVNSTHFYFMHSSLKGDQGDTFIARDLRVFSSGLKNFFIVRPDLNKGIQCRFGMRGIIAEAHYDGGRNNVVMIKGAKRYILTAPDQCKYLNLIADRDHPSYRHSTIDWSDPVAAKKNFQGATGIDTIVRTGEMLYIPSYWIHYIISLNYSIQCNSRSGPPPEEEGLEDIDKCMHDDKFKNKMRKAHGRRKRKVY